MLKMIRTKKQPIIFLSKQLMSQHLSMTKIRNSIWMETKLSHLRKKKENWSTLRHILHNKLHTKQKPNILSTIKWIVLLRIPKFTKNNLLVQSRMRHIHKGKLCHQNLSLNRRMLQLLRLKRRIKFWDMLIGFQIMVLVIHK